jgi:hypothetical protein
MAEALFKALQGLVRRITPPFLQTGYLRGMEATPVRELLLGELRLLTKVFDGFAEGDELRI